MTPRLALLLALAPAPLAAQEAADPAAAVAWLAGCWERRAGALVTEEQWMAPAGGVLLGMSRTVREGRLVEHESVRIRAAGDTLEYVALPVTASTPTVFRATAASAPRALVFENPAHDFPQRILYRAVGPDSLHARIEGTRDGRVRGVDFRYARVPCGTAPAPVTLAVRAHHLDAMAAFYEGAFGLRFRPVETGPHRSLFGEAAGFTLKLVPIRDAADFTGYPVHQPGFEVADSAALARVVALAERHGGRREGAMQRVDGRLVAAVRDPDGNTVELRARR